MFEMRDGTGDRMWVLVTAVKKRKLVGRLTNMPFMIPRLMPGAKIKFKREHIIDIWYDDDTGKPAGDEGQDPDHPGARLLCQGCNGHTEHGKELASERTDRSADLSAPVFPAPAGAEFRVTGTA